MRSLLLLGGLVLGATAFAGEPTATSSVRRGLDGDQRREMSGAVLMGTGSALVLAGLLQITLEPCTDTCEGPPMLRLAVGPQTLTAGVGALIWGGVLYARGHRARSAPVAIPVLAPSPRGVEAGLYVRF